MNERRFIIQAVVVLIGLIFIIKLFTIQVMENNFKKAAENNIVQRVVEYPFRGLIYDRNKELLVHNQPVFDIMVIPNEVSIKDTLAFCELFNFSREEVEKRLKEASKYSYVKPSIFSRTIPITEFSKMEDKLNDYEGFYPNPRTVRGYNYNIASNTLGYIAEINKNELQLDSSNYYKQGDYIGKSGLERTYEQYLRGKRGVQYKMVNVQGIEKGSFKEGSLDTASIPGEKIITTIDKELQLYGEYLMKGKVGSAVAIEPATGEILCIISSPSYEPGLLSGREFSSSFSALRQDTLIPLFNRPLMAMYPPGSIFKTVQALIGLEQGVIRPGQMVYIDHSNIGDHAPMGLYDIKKAIKYSSNNYFFKAFRQIINQNDHENTFIDSRIGLEKWRDFLLKFGMGQPLGVDLPNEKGGLIPSISYYDRIYGENRWKFSTISSLSIGQDALLMTPIQMANLGATLANRGYFYTPHLIKEIGESGVKPEKYTKKRETGVDSAYYELVIDAMSEALKGTAWRAVIPGIEMCGKTGTAENPHGADHSVFMSFAPRDTAQIAISVYVENAGWGGRAAASTASLMIEYYLTGEVKRQWLEDYVVKGDFFD